MLLKRWKNSDRVKIAWDAYPTWEENYEKCQ